MDGSRVGDVCRRPDRVLSTRIEGINSKKCLE
jgi:hypothetical protein